MGCGSSTPAPEAHKPVKGKKEKRAVEEEPKDAATQSPVKKKAAKKPKWSRGENPLHVSVEGMGLVSSSWEKAQMAAAKEDKLEEGALGVRILKKMVSSASHAEALFASKNRTPQEMGPSVEKEFERFIQIVKECEMREDVAEKEELLKPVYALVDTHVAFGVGEYDFTLMWKATGEAVKELLIHSDAFSQQEEQLIDYEATRKAWRAFSLYLGRTVTAHIRSKTVPKPVEPPHANSEGRSVLLQKSWEAIIDKENKEATFWTKLFHRSPHLRTIKTESTGECAMMSCIAELIEETGKLPVEELSEIGVRHMLYGVQTRDFTHCGFVFRDTFLQGVPQRTRAAWVNFFNDLGSVMYPTTQKGVERESSESEFAITNEELNGTNEWTIDPVELLWQIKPTSAALEMLHNSRKPTT